MSLRVEQVEVRVASRGEGLFEFACPDCLRGNLRPLAASDVAVLLAAGVEPAPGPGPFELLERHDGPPIDWDDIIDLHEALVARASHAHGAEVEPALRIDEAEREAA